MFIYAGIDEAGYGPMLGPLVVASTCFAILDHPSPTPASLPCLWTLLDAAVSKENKAGRGRLIVNDSKKVKLPNPKSHPSEKQKTTAARHPLTHLEPGVLAFLAATAAAAAVGEGGDRQKGPLLPASDDDLLQALDPELRQQIRDIPWYIGNSLPLPQSVPDHDNASIRIALNVLDRAMKKSHVEITQMAAHSLTAARFNQLAGSMRSKSAVSMHLVGRLLYRIIEKHGQHHPYIAVDRQGGTTHYRHALQTLFPQASIRIVEEVDHASTYQLEFKQKHSATVSFSKSGDSIHFPTALASMTAKYLRELMMIRFNRYFLNLMPEVKPTAGYVQDARRFLKDVEPVLRDQRLPRDRLIRSC